MLWLEHYILENLSCILIINLWKSLTVKPMWTKSMQDGSYLSKDLLLSSNTNQENWTEL